jgi:hypothetical protein
MEVEFLAVSNRFAYVDGIGNDFLIKYSLDTIPIESSSANSKYSIFCLDPVSPSLSITSLLASVSLPPILFSAFPCLFMRSLSPCLLMRYLSAFLSLSRSIHLYVDDLLALFLSLSFFLTSVSADISSSTLPHCEEIQLRPSINAIMILCTCLNLQSYDIMFCNRTTLYLAIVRFFIFCNRKFYIFAIVRESECLDCKEPLECRVI